MAPAGAGARRRRWPLWWVLSGDWRDSLPDPSLERVGLGILGTLATWLMIVAILGFGRRYLDRTSPTLAYLAEGSYPVYILHQTVIVVFAFYIVGWAIPEALQWIALLIARGGRDLRALRGRAALVGDALPVRDAAEEARRRRAPRPGRRAPGAGAAAWTARTFLASLTPRRPAPCRRAG